MTYKMWTLTPLFYLPVLVLCLWLGIIYTQQFLWYGWVLSTRAKAFSLSGQNFIWSGDQKYQIKSKTAEEIWNPKTYTSEICIYLLLLKLTICNIFVVSLQLADALDFDAAQANQTNQQAGGPAWPGQPTNPSWPGQPSGPYQPWPGQQPGMPAWPNQPNQPAWPGQPGQPSAPGWPGPAPPTAPQNVPLVRL